MNIKLIKSSISYSQDVVNIVREYADIMDTFFSNIDNQIAHEYCYKAYIELSRQLKDKAVERGLVKCHGKNL